jgi:DNA helicase II / ATP-dependent DNA helicase PcrA
MVDQEGLLEAIANTVCAKPAGMSSTDCFLAWGKSNPLCQASGHCRIGIKSPEQLDYVVQPFKTASFLDACPGSGKTEVIGLRAAYEMRSQQWRHSGIAVLTFTNAAAKVIRERVTQFVGAVAFPHFVGTIDGWLHAYLLNPFGHFITNYAGKDDGDRTVRIVETGSFSPWLNAHKCPTPYIVGDAARLKFHPLFANHIFCDVEAHGFALLNPFAANEETVADGDYVNSEAFRTYAADKPWLTLKRLRRALMECKRGFWRAGFVTFPDAEVICYLLLRRRSDLARLIAQRFPVLMIDECQDLSWTQMEILRLLRDQGSTLHVVGDLNQAIFGFRKVDPERVLEFIESAGLSRLSLRHNYRSVQPIVDVCCRLVSAEHPITGQPDPGSRPACVFFTYERDAPHSVIAAFERCLEPNTPLERVAVLARSHTLIAKLRPSTKSIPSQQNQRLATALHLWKEGGLPQTDRALHCMGGVVATNFWAGQHSDARSHQRPETFESPMRWRLFLARLLDACLGETQIGNLTLTWKTWSAQVRAELPRLVARSLSSDPPSRPTGPWLKAPPGKASDSVILSLGEPLLANDSRIPVTTIHQAKGDTYDAVLLVSSWTRAGDGAHWSQWLDPSAVNAEHRRFAYVGSSRPRKLLAWAVPAGDDTAVSRLLELGFVPAVCSPCSS